KGGLDLKRYTNSGINIIAIDILEYGKNIEKAWQKIEPFIEECHLNKFQVAILNVNTVEELMLARKYMADYIFGRGVGALEQSPGHMKRIKWHELLEAL
ncbi:MAG: hypothetical protein HN572_10935, partial [Kordiimonadaceae bacterium]|nr:hypothetical protein [Kordiimonadaceae bacterium]